MKLSVLLVAGVSGGCVDKLGWSPAQSTSSAAGSMQAIAGGKLYGWGDNTYSASGATKDMAVPPILSKPTPTIWNGMYSMSLSDVAGVRAGVQHTCALQTNGTAYCWGNEDGDGFTGVATAAQKNWPTVPLMAAGATAFTDITTGNDFTCVVRKSDGIVWCFGNNDAYALDGGVAATGATGVAVPGVPASQSVSAGLDFACALTTTNYAYCWGTNAVGQLGNGAETSCGPSMVTLADLAGIQPGTTHTCAWTTAGAAYCWGDNQYGQVGTGAATTSYNTPQALMNIGWVTGIAPGFDHTCSWNNAGSVYCWGTNAMGQLGQGHVVTMNAPSVVTVYGATAVQSSQMASCAIVSGSVYCWGNGAVSLNGGISGIEAATPVPYTTVPVMIADADFWCKGSKGAGKGKAKGPAAAAAGGKKAKKVAGMLVGGAVAGVAIAGLAVRRYRKRNYTPIATPSPAV